MSTLILGLLLVILVVCVNVQCAGISKLYSVTLVIYGCTVAVAESVVCSIHIISNWQLFLGIVLHNLPFHDCSVMDSTFSDDSIVTVESSETEACYPSKSGTLRIAHLNCCSLISYR